MNSYFYSVSVTPATFLTEWFQLFRGYQGTDMASISGGVTANALVRIFSK